MEATVTHKDVQYLTEIDKSRLIIDNLNLIQNDEIKGSDDYQQIIDWHEDRIRFYLDLLNKYYQKNAQI